MRICTIVFANLSESINYYKVRARKGLEEVGKGAKSDNKHYRPWEDEAKAVLSQSKVFDQLSHRALVIAYLKACVLYVANGCKWEKNIETFVSWSLRNDLWCKIHFFGYMLEQGSDKFANPSRGPKNQLFMLPNVYTLNDLKNVRLKCGMKEEGADVQNRQWLSRGFVTVVTDKKDTYKKLKYLSA